MAIVYKVLGQSNPSATTQTTLYTVPASTSAVVSTVTITNLAGTDATFRLAVRPAGETLANKHYITYDTTVPANDMVALTLGVTLATTDVVACYASTANVSFGIFGSEIS
jgi:glucose-6-phosphate dehydrogenase assembly protein OpcA